MRAFPVLQSGSDAIRSRFSFVVFLFPFVCLQDIFTVGFPEDYGSLWIAIDTCIRTLNSTVCVDVGHSTGFKDPLELLPRKCTQNNFESNLCSILIFSGLNSEGRRIGDTGAVFFLRLARR